MIYIPPVEDYPPLTPEEEKLSMAKYYYRPLEPLNPLYEKALESCPLPKESIPDPSNWTDLILPEGYNGTEFGYAMMDNGAGYLAVYTVTYLPGEMRDWWFQWMGVKPKSMPEGCGNICYKIWCPPDHFEADHSKNVGMEHLDLGQGDPYEEIINYKLDPFEYGMTRELDEKLKAADVHYELGYEKFDHPGTHITFRVNRPCKTGGRESFGREWLGYKPVDGKFVRDEETPCSEEYLRKIVIHNVIEDRHLEAMLPELYAEYADQPMDCD